MEEQESKPARQPASQQASKMPVRLASSCFTCFSQFEIMSKSQKASLRYDREATSTRQEVLL